MTDERVRAIEALLTAAGDAHEVFERDELHGVYDEHWPAWYARYAVEHGLGAILGRDVDAQAASEYFARTWAEAQTSGSKPAEPWATWMARRVATEL